MVRHSNASELWKNLDWKKLQKEVFRLQCRIYKAMRANDKRKVVSLQKLLLKSKAARLIAIRQVTQLNQGKRTAGVNGRKNLDFSERLELEETLRKHFSNWKHSDLREIPIPKKDGTMRLLKVPTIEDRAWQCLAKLAIEPAHEATFREKSYGFRPGKSTHDAQHMVNHSLSSRNSGINKMVIELDIEKCFDRLDHNVIMNQVIAPRGIQTGIYRCLKSGTNPGYSNSGTPQGGVISPLLANIALNGIEDICKYHGGKFRGKRKRITPKTPMEGTVNPIIRYADDMVVILPPDIDPQGELDKIAIFLAKRGLQVSAKKTKITKSTDGFDFLGWNFKVRPSGKVISTPSKNNYEAVKKKIKNIVQNSQLGAKEKARLIAPIVRGWRNYHRHCIMTGMNHRLWGIEHSTWKKFRKEKTATMESTTKLIETAFPKVPVKFFGHKLVKGSKSPFDGDIVYWSKRQSNNYDNETGKALRKQAFTCGLCNLGFVSEERIHLHHADGNHDNWKKDNLLAVHESCHKIHHMGKRSSGAGCTETGTSRSK